MSESRKKSSSTCLTLLSLGALLFLVTCKTEVGWSWFYPLGSLTSDVRQTVQAHGLNLTLERARLRLGSRAGYAVLSLVPGSESGLESLSEVNQDPESPRPVEVPFGLPEKIEEEVKGALLLERCRMYRGQSTVGEVELERVIYLPETKRVYLTFHYRYG